MSESILTVGRKQLEADLAGMPAAVKKRIVVAADEQGATFGFAQRTDNGWEISASVEQRWAKQRPNARLTLGKDWP